MGWTHLLVSFSAKLLFSHLDKIQKYIYCYGQKCFSSLFIYSYAMTLAYNMYNIIGDELLLNFGAKFQR